MWNEILSLKNYCCGTSGRGRSVSVRYAKQTDIFFGYATDPLSTDFVSQTAVNKLITRHRNSHSLLPFYYYHSMNLHVFRAEIHTPRWQSAKPDTHYRGTFTTLLYLFFRSVFSFTEETIGSYLRCVRSISGRRFEIVFIFFLKDFQKIASKPVKIDSRQYFGIIECIKFSLVVLISVRLVDNTIRCGLKGLTV